MALTKISGEVIQSGINIGIVTATRIDGNVSGNVNSTGVSTFSTLKVGTGVTINSGIVTATTFSGNLTGNVTGNATGLSGTPNITVGAINASSAIISGNVSVAGTITYEDTTNVDSIGVITARSGIHVIGGSIGIGTNNPTAKLQVVGSTDLTKLNLSGISSSISSTAVDVFVYDTRKDSDGGAWRKRTQNTSWYNETLNTATRGSRKDFPAVAVIVATTTTVTIYDGDDPDMPMWMVFQSSGYGMSGVYMFNAGSVVNSSIYALNGILVGGQYQASDTYGSPIINFISEKVVRMDPDSSEGGLWLGNIADRNSGKGYASRGSTGQGYAIVDSRINDVAMTVLPNAPFDAATGLPVPTIAVATAGGTSIIRDDGTVANITYTNFNVANSVHFTKDNKIAILTDNATGGARFYRIYEIPTSSLNGGAYNNMGSALRAYGGDSVAYNYPIRYFWYSNTIDTGNFYANALVYAKDGPVFGRNGRGISLISEGNTNLPGENIPVLSTSAGMVCGISSSVNTGWMHGDIKGAWLSDTSTASVTGTELHPNGNWDFASSNVSYISNTASGTATVVSGQLQLSGGTSNYSDHIISIATVVGKQYVITIDYVTAVAGQQIGIYHQNTNVYLTASDGQGIAARSSGTKLNWHFTAVSTSTGLDLVTTGTTANIHVFDNWSIRLAEPDCSVNAKGLAVYGTITKSAVATGSNLVAYSGFSASNYLQQPYNSSLNFNTGDFSFLFWIYPTGTSYGGVISRGSNGVYGPYALTYSSNSITFVTSSDWNESTDNGTWGTIIANVGVIPSNTWSFVAATFSGTTARVYVNGVVVGTQTNAVNPKAPTSNFIPTMIGVERTPLTGSIGRPFPGSLALVRASASAPSPTQIAKIYNDEKMLFQENSQCTLYGSSDAVTALAYDDTTKLLSVGTSSGRSDFQGLERINNTTTAVTTAISASNGLIAEQ